MEQQSASHSEVYEEEHVHQVYEKIASHFSSTRYKPWPIVEKFLLNMPVGSIGLDIGCGNGKYLSVNPNLFIVASDRSETLVRIASERKGASAIIATNLSLPHQVRRFDFAISIAVIHHLSTRLRRVRAIAAILETLHSQWSLSMSETPEEQGIKSTGKALIFVWALEQKGSRRGWDENHEQDVMVPWVLQEKRSGTGEAGKPPSNITFHRYYHLYKVGELEEDINEAGGKVLESGYERDNWWAVAVRLPGRDTGATDRS
ncbi:tRNA methyltransferase, has a role in tRNA modification [Agyrium rufum]|nr:tRNA methyltransferase, has a role in tRNA modification [Agyrium rufum]